VVRKHARETTLLRGTVIIYICRTAMIRRDDSSLRRQIAGNSRSRLALGPLPISNLL